MSKLLLPARYAEFLLLSFLIAMPVWAEKPEKGGQGHKHEHQHKYEHSNDRYNHDHDHGSDVNMHVDLFFGETQRTVIRDYYGAEFSDGHCPPGLAKKRNGCMPPGQAKKWRRGYPLPRDVIYYDLPPQLIVELGSPPIGHKYVRIAADILLIALGTGMVVDAIEDLSRL